MKTRAIPETTRQTQLAVSDPSASAWVSANAGSGKTYVLAQRVIRLLLRGEPPGRILCLTFTKAAAAHMANQVLKTLRGWVSLDDAALDEALARIDNVKPSSARRAEARRLFATALETPGGLKVQTIHAFCDRVLHQFPFEAGVPAGFTVLEETASAELLENARASVLLAAARSPESELGRALSLAVSTDTDTRLADVFDEVVRARRKLAYLLEENGLAQAQDTLCSALHLQPGDSVAAAETEILASEFLPREEWKSIAETLIALGGNPKARGEQLLKASLADDTERVDTYLLIFCTNEGGLRDIKGFGAEKLRDSDPTVQRMLAEYARVALLVERRRAVQAFERSCALNILGRAMISRYEEMKHARAALDYDDLVSKTADLLENQAAAWVHYKLDGGIDHILIDEAQDTSPEQWRVVESLAQEFFAGKGAAERKRTIFAVGDEKQSIFGFQGAEPKSFEEMRRAFDKKAKNAGLDFESKRLDLSFRSAIGIVKAVDEVFREPENFRGLSSGDATRTVHTAIRDNAPALVEVWETVKPPESRESELAWDAPLDAESFGSPPAMLAVRIAKAVRTILDKGEFPIGDPETDTPRRPHAGDIIVLVRSRGPLFDAILRELKQSNVPVAGADRLKLSEHIAVMDIAALCDALLLPSDDLALACALKSPIFGFSEDELYEIAYKREGTLDAALFASTQPKFKDAAEKLSCWRAEARALRPFDFLSRFLGRDQARERILGRLGLEATDALDELLSQSLAYESVETPSLVGFLVFLRRSTPQVKRDLEVESHAVRVMTVHGVKGLEAPIVILADTTSTPDSKRHHPKLMPLSTESREVLIWAAGEDSVTIATAREAIAAANEGEHRRLLYVALTRARDALIVCGAEPRAAKLHEGCWYNLVHGALKREEDEFKEIANHGYGITEKVFRWRFRPVNAVAALVSQKASELAEPAWLHAPVPESGKIVQIASASSQAVDSSERAVTRRRGVLIHRLLQELPRIEPSRREEGAQNYLKRFAAELDETARKAIVAEALDVLARPELANLFGPMSRAEVPLIDRMEDERRIDRLAVTEHEVLIADFKSDAVPPVSVSATPKVYIEQLARYRRILEKLYPGKAMRAYLVWTATGTVHDVPLRMLD